MTAEHVRGLLPLLAALPLSQRVDLSAAIADAVEAAYLRGVLDGRRLAQPAMPMPVRGAVTLRGRAQVQP